MKERIEQILEDKRITQAEFANRAGISPATITHLFNGRNNLSETVVSKILLAYPEINPLWLLDGKGEKYQKVREQLPLFNEGQMIKEKHFFSTPRFKEQDDNENIDIQIDKVELPRTISSAESNIAPLPIAAQTVAQQPATTKKQIRKIVFFYTDKTFEEYYPE